METRENTLSERERYILNALLNDADEVARRRACALLDWADGKPTKIIAQELNVRAPQVRKLTRDFAQKRLEVFPLPSLERAMRGAAGPATVTALIEKYPTNPKHLNHVAALALQLFDGARQAHHLALPWRRVLEAGARMHNLGSQTTDESRHVFRAHDIILAYDLQGFTPLERDVIACLTLFYRKKGKPQRDAIFAAFAPDLQHATLALAAILRVANALDITNTQSAAIHSISVNTVTEVAVMGRDAEENAACAAKRADLWQKVLAPPLVVRVETDEPNPTVTARAPVRQRGSSRRAQPLQAERASKPPPPAWSADDSIGAVARAVISGQFIKLESLTQALRANEDVEAVHDMRVACRRLISAFRLFQSYLPAKATRKLRPVLKELRDALGAARNLDVLLANVEAYQNGVEAELRADLDHVVEVWRAERALEQQKLVALIDSPEYQEWADRMVRFVGEPPKPAPRIAELVPALVWREYAAVRAYETRLGTCTLDELHRLRIEIKRLRYTLEFFADAFGAKPVRLIEPLVALQDHLGAIQDCVVAGAALTDFIGRQAHAARHAGTSVPAFRGVAAYHAQLQERIETLRAELLEHWQIVVSSSYRRELGETVALL